MTVQAPARQSVGPRVVPLMGVGSWRVVERNFLVYRDRWPVFVAGMLEPVLYLLSIGIGVGVLVGEIPVGDGRTVDYVDFVAPAMLATSAMNGTILDATFNFFFRLKYGKLYDAILATPMRPFDIAQGEITWALLRGTCYSLSFILVMAVMGLVHSWWMLLALPATMLIGFGFAGAGLALTTWMRSWQDFEYISLAIMPMFLFSATFYPLSTYPEPVQEIVRWTPLYQGVVLTRGMSFGTLGWDAVVAVVYLAAMGGVGLYVASRRVGVLLLK